jgi:hypothetical protein
VSIGDTLAQVYSLCTKPVAQNNITCQNGYRPLSNKLTSHPNPSQPVLYQIRIKGHLDSQWTNWFEGLTIRLEDDGDTLLTGSVADQAALHGLLKKVRDLGLALISINRMDESEKELIMKTAETIHQIKDRRVILSTLWIFAMFNYLYNDVYGLHFNPVLQKEFVQKFISGYIGPIQITQGFVLITAILMETAIAMALLSRILKYGANRWANIGAGILHTAFVFLSLSGGTTLYYAFFATIEIACTLFIIWYAWTWRNTEV